MVKRKSEMKTTLIPTVDYWKASVLWMTFIDWPAGFEKFTEMKLISATQYHHFIEVSEESARKIRMILSPHYKTIIKAYLRINK